MTEQTEAFLTAWTVAEQAGGLADTRFGLDQVQADSHGEVTVVTGRHTSAGTRAAPALPGPAPQTVPDAPQ
jgi:hypothetical protein